MASTNSYPSLEPRVAALLRHHASRLAASDHRLEQEDVEQELATHRVLGHHRSSIYAWLATLRERGRSAGLGIYVSATPTDPVSAE